MKSAALILVPLLLIVLVRQNLASEGSGVDDLPEINPIESVDDYLKMLLAIHTIPVNYSLKDWPIIRDRRVELYLMLIQIGLDFVGEDFDPDDLPGIPGIPNISIHGSPGWNPPVTPDEPEATDSDKNNYRTVFQNKSGVLQYTRITLNLLKRFVSRHYDEADQETIFSRIYSIESSWRFLESSTPENHRD